MPTCHYLHSVFETSIRHLQKSQTKGCLEAKPTCFYLSTCIGTNIQKAKPHVECMKPDLSLLLARAQDNFYHSDFPLLAQLLKLLLRFIGLKSTLTNLNLRIPQSSQVLCHFATSNLSSYTKYKIKFISNE